MTRPKSETPEEQPEEPTPDLEPDTEEEEQPEEEEQLTPAEAAAQDGSDLMVRNLQAAISDYHAIASEIVGVDTTDYACESCGGKGWTNTPLMLMDGYAMDETKQKCPTCRGKGQLISHSEAPGHELTTCASCSGQGWTVKSAPQENVVQFQPAAPAQTFAPAPPQYGYMNQDGQFIPFVNTSPG